MSYTEKKFKDVVPGENNASVLSGNESTTPTFIPLEFKKIQDLQNNDYRELKVFHFENRTAGVSKDADPMNSKTGYLSFRLFNSMSGVEFLVNLNIVSCKIIKLQLENLLKVVKLTVNYDVGAGMSIDDFVILYNMSNKDLLDSAIKNCKNKAVAQKLEKFKGSAVFASIVSSESKQDEYSEDDSLLGDLFEVEQTLDTTFDDYDSDDDYVQGAK
jgi:hypothetical protein